MNAMIDLVQQFDHELFIWLNGIHSPWLDIVMYWVTFKFTWIPLYIILVLLSIKYEKTRSIAIMITVVIAVIIADKITSGLMKPYFMRLRPCHDPSMKHLLHQVGDCGGLYGFASSHASTSFALAITWFLLLKKKLKYMVWLLFWAALYSYSRIYVGVHYPGDIMVGAAVGLLTGTLCVQIYDTIIKKY